MVCLSAELLFKCVSYAEQTRGLVSSKPYLPSVKSKKEGLYCVTFPGFNSHRNKKIFLNIYKNRGHVFCVYNIR